MGGQDCCVARERACWGGQLSWLGVVDRRCAGTIWPYTHDVSDRSVGRRFACRGADPDPGRAREGHARITCMQLAAASSQEPLERWRELGAGRRLGASIACDGILGLYLVLVIIVAVVGFFLHGIGILRRGPGAVVVCCPDSRCPDPGVRLPRWQDRDLGF